MKVQDGRWICRLLCLGVLLAGCGLATAQIPDEFTNLQILPKEIGKRDLLDLMKDFSQALGVRCSFCHVEKTPDSLEGMDFATDKLGHKKVSRAMMQMAGEINGRLLPATGMKNPLRVSCMTCHRGVVHPQSLDDLLVSVAEKDGAAAAETRYRELRDEYHGTGAYDFSAGTLGSVAETLAQEKGDIDGAIRLTKMNIDFHPDDAYAHLLLGQMLAKKGDRAAAIESIERSLELEPGNRWAKGLLEQVRSSE